MLGTYYFFQSVIIADEKPRQIYVFSKYNDPKENHWGGTRHQYAQLGMVL